MNSDYEKNSLTLGGAVAMGTGVMIGAGIFALTGQIAELAVKAPLRTEPLDASHGLY